MISTILRPTAVVAAALVVVIGLLALVVDRGHPEQAPAKSARVPAVEALTRAGTAAMERHDFRAALRAGEAARRAAPQSLLPYPVLVDANIELGRYERARVELQRMVDAKPTLAAYARVSYLRELLGDLPGAVRAMRLAVAAGSGAAEDVAVVRTLLGDLELRRGRRSAARRVYREALAIAPGHSAAQVGLAALDAASGRLGPAMERLRRVVARSPLPEHLVALGETQLAAGRTAEGRRTLEQARIAERRHGAGENNDIELALLEAEHGDAHQAVGLARRAWAAAPSVRSAHALTAALTAAGRPREALPWARRSLELGWREPTALVQAARSAHAAGANGLARRWIREALRGADALSPWQAARARALSARIASRVTATSRTRR